LNAYLGPGWSSEARATDRLGDTVGHSFGVEAPLGFEFAHGIRRILLVRSYSVLLTAINPGKLLQVYHGSDSATAGPDDTRFRDIVAPGIYVSVGLGEKVPLSLCAGYEFAAGLRREAGTGNRMDVQRIVIMLGLDMPLFRF